MIKNYFIELGGIFKTLALFFKDTFKKYAWIIWLLILVQLGLGTGLLYIIDKYALIGAPIGVNIGSIFMVIFFITAFLFMFKMIFNMASSGLEKENISNFRIVKSLLMMAVLNCFPLLLLYVFYNLALLVPDFAIGFKIMLNFFTYLFYLSMSLAICSIVYYQDNNVLVAILKSIKLFFQKLKFTFISVLILFILAGIVSFVLCAILYAIGLYVGFLTDNLVHSINALVNVYALYVFSGLYIGYQVAIYNKLKK